MNINYKESQIDFLSHVEGKVEDSARPRYMAAQISLSLENLVIFTIVAIMVVIFSFSLGIERGKGVALMVPAAAVADKKEAPVASSTSGPELKADTQKTKSIIALPKAVAKGKTTIAVPVVTAVKPVKAGAYTLQVASYKGLKSAQREADKLKQKGFNNVYVLPKGTYTVVCVGNFQNKEDASDVKRQLNNRYQGSVVRRL
jgi:hypothetical protein